MTWRASQKWADGEKTRKSSWESVVLTHKRKRYVKGLAEVRKHCDINLRLRACELEHAVMEISEWRTALSDASGVAFENRRAP